ncbi:Uncharacterised protein [Mycobacterium tuberculosis]|nr:Uncharacterised protein [Mycobacterium tuberculosis]
MGAIIRTIDDGSITLPARRSNRLTRSRNVIQLMPLPVIHAAIVCGICSLVIRNENSTALVTM